MDDESDEEDPIFTPRDTHMEHATDEDLLSSVDEGGHPISPIKEEDRGCGIPSKHVRFEDTGSHSNTTPRLMLLGLNANAQQSHGNLYMAGTDISLPHMVDTTEDDGVGVSMEDPGDTPTGRNIEDRAGIILVSQYLLSPSHILRVTREVNVSH